MHTDPGLIGKGKRIVIYMYIQLNNLICREALWQYFLPTLFEDSPVTPEPSVGQTRIFRFVRFKLWLSCPSTLDLHFMHKMVCFSLLLLFT